MWSIDKCQCEFKNAVNHKSIDTSIVDDLVITCDEIIDALDTMSIYLNDKSSCLKDNHILYFLFVAIRH